MKPTRQWLFAAIAVVILTAIILLAGRVAHAAPLQPSQATCRPNQFNQQDIAGTYESSMMYAAVDPCGGLIIAWMNRYGEHAAGYFGFRRVQSGGVIFEGYIPDDKIGAYLDSVPYVALTPAEPGWVYLTTLTDTGTLVSRYRLMKTS